MRNSLTIKFDIYNLIAILGIFAITFALWDVRGFLLNLVVALVISTFIEDFVIRGEKYKIPRVMSVLSFFVVLLVVFGAVITFLVPVIINELGTVAQYYPEVSQFINLEVLGGGQLDEVSSLSDIFERLKELNMEEIFKNIGSIFGGVFNLVVIFIVAFYLSMQDHGLDRLLKIVAPKAYEKSVMRVWHNTQKKIGGWFRGQLIIALILMVITYIGLSLIGIPYALLLSLLAGLFGLVPYGIFIATIPAMLLGFVYGGWQTGLFVLAFYWLVQQVLDFGIQPYLFKKMTGIPSLLVILSVIAGAQLFGLAGLIIAIPAALFGLEVFAEIEHQKEKHAQKTLF